MKAKPKLYPIFLTVLAVCCALFVSLGGVRSSLALFSFPFYQLGALLRAMSLSGSLGNAAAIAVYAILCLAPLVYGAVRLLRSRAVWCDGLLPILTALLFWGLYLMINPALITRSFNRLPSAQSGAALIGCTIYAVLLGYILLRVLAAVKAAGDKTLYTALDVLLAVGGTALILAAFGGGFGELPAALEQLRAGNTAPGQHLGLTQFFITLRCCTDALPYVLGAYITVRARQLGALLAQDRYSQAAVDTAQHFARLCARVLCVTVAANTAFNLLQLLFARKLLVIDSFAAFPLFSVMLTLAAMLLGRLIAEGKELRDDNDAFI